MHRRQPQLWTSIVLMVSAVAFAGTAVAQQDRIREYGNKLKEEIEKEAQKFRSNLIREQRQELASLREERAPIRRRTPAERQPAEEEEETQERRQELEQSIDDLQEPVKSVVNVHESNDGEGQDVEIRLTMPVDAFMEFAPIAALEAAAIPHKFPVVNIYLREEKTDRVARVAFRDAEPIAGRYQAGDEDAVEEMKETIIWH